VGVPAESQMKATLPGALGYRGIALPSAMFALVAVSILAAGVFAFADLNAKATLNQERTTRAMQVADAGISHAVSMLRASPMKSLGFSRILRGADNLIVPATDDTVLAGAGYTALGLAVANQIPLAGVAYQGHTYFVSIRDDPADGDLQPSTDLNGRVLLRCRAVAADGTTAEVSAIVGAVPQPGFAADGNAAFTGSPQIGGPCGGAHANGNISSTGGGPIINTQVSATGTVTGSWNKPDGTAAPTAPNSAPVDVPDLNPADYCTGAQADFRLLAGGVAQNGAGGVIVVPAGWAYNAGTLTWTLDGGTGNPPIGTYCVTGNAIVTGNVGTAATPKKMSVIATGSIRMEGTPYLVADHDDNILALAGGDLYLAGNAAAGATSYSGLLYARAQCLATGSFVATGQLLCANNANPVGATQWTAVHDISGNFTLNFDCSGNLFNKRRVLYWYPRIGT
jgi:hypothetical protein